MELFILFGPLYYYLLLIHEILYPLLLFFEFVSSQKNVSPITYIIVILAVTLRLGLFA